jgi:hypothetical protein
MLYGKTLERFDPVTRQFIGIKPGVGIGQVQYLSVAAAQLSQC